MLSECNNDVIELLEPTFDDELKVSHAIVKRRSIRSYKAADCDKQMLSNLCYFSAGVTAKEKDLKANPTTNNRQEIDLYVFTAIGIFFYDPKAHVLRRISSEDHRAATGTQSFAADSTYDFVYVINGEKFAPITDEMKWVFCSGTDSAFMAHNTVLYATSVGLDSVVRLLFDKEVVHKLLRLNVDDVAVLAVSVGVGQQ